MTPPTLLRAGETLAAIGAAWLLTYALHSTVLIVTSWVLQRARVVTSLRLRDLAWRGALVGGLFTATLQLACGLAPWGFTLEAPRPAARLSVSSTVRPPEAVASPLLEAAHLEDTALATAATLPPAAAPAEAVPAVAVPELRVGSLLFMAWVAVSTALLVRLAVARARVVEHLGLRTPVLEPSVRAQLDRLCDEAGRDASVRLTTAQGLKSPVALGWSEICVPAAVLTELDAAQQRSVLAHELAHLQRLDPLWLLLSTTLEQLLFFQPLNRLVRRNLQEVAEYLCDDWAATRDGSGLPVARVLASVARWLDGEERAVPLAGMAERPSLLVARVERLLGASSVSLEPRRSWHLWALGLALLLTAAVVPGVRASPAVGWFEGEVAPEAPASPPEESPPEPAPEAAPAPSPSPHRRQADEARRRDEEKAVRDEATAVRDERLAHAAFAQVAPVAALAAVAAVAPVAAVAVAAVPPVPPLPALPKGLDVQLQKQWAHAQRELARTRAKLLHVSVNLHGHHRGNNATPADPATVDALVKALQDADAGVREAAAESLGRLGDGRALEGLATATSDTDAKVRLAAVEALACLDDAGAIPALAKALKDTNVAIRREAAQALARLDAPGVVEPLVAALGDADAHVRLASVEGLARRGDKRALAALSALVKDSSPEVRATAVAALGELKDASALPALTAALKDESAEVREQAVCALAHLGLPSAVPALIQATHDASRGVRARAAAALAGLRDSANAPAVVAALKALLEDSDAEVREEAVDALTEIRDAGAVQALIAAMQSKDPVVRKAAAAALGQRD
jgi:HEAT repeat protein/Zn-dependent protease with chaperone function